MDLILVRHGQSQYNFDQTGGADAPLTELGRQQAQRVGVYLAARFKLIALYASTYIRARETAEIINRFVGLPEIQLMEDLREASEDYAPGMRVFDSPRAALRRREPIRPAYVSDYYITFQERVQRALEQILAVHADAADSAVQIGIVSHGGTCGTILRTLMGSHHFGLHTENTGIHIVRWAEQRWHLVALNRVEHLLSASDLVALPEGHEQPNE